MFYFFYDVILVCAAFGFGPKIIWQRFIQGHYRGRFRELLFGLVKGTYPKKGRVHLLYAVSMGETKAAASLFKQMKRACPEDQFYVASRTQTGHEEAQKSLSGADGYFLLPLDFSWAMKRFLRALRPDTVIIVENDFWLNFMRLAKCMGARVFLVSGKVSTASFERFKKVAFFSKRLFSLFDFMCLQTHIFKERFISLGVHPDAIAVTGNLKCDTSFQNVDKESFRESLGFDMSDTLVVLASTHAQEEELLLQQLLPLKRSMQSLKFLVVPRHPERFSDVKNLLIRLGLNVGLYSCKESLTGREEIVLIDAMGLLLSIYQIADLAIVGGSFRRPLQGHNIYEPVQAGTPVLFGPHMNDQKPLVECVLSAGAGRQVTLKELAPVALELLTCANLSKEMKEFGKRLLVEMEGSSVRTWEVLEKKILCY